MPKKKKHSSKQPIIISVALAIIVTLVGFTTYNREDLGTQLPPPSPDSIYKQPEQPIETRVSDLLGYMTLEEKIGQMSLVDKNSLIKNEDIARYNIGAVLSGAGAKPDNNTPLGWADLTESLKSEVTNTRLQIPILYGIDANHGHANVPGATVFPHAIGLGASNDPELVERIAQATSEELFATGINWNYSPSLDAPKDIRWGRVYEAFSDDPAIISQLGAAYIQGTQDSQSNVLASAKHFVGTGSMQWGTSEHKTYQIDHGATPEDEQALRNYYILPYRSAVDSGVSSVMTALSRYGRDRVINSKYLISDVLKDELGFKGFVVSDWYGVYEYADSSKYDANVRAINAGLDMAMLPFDYKSFLKDVRKAVEINDIPISRIDDAVSRILRQKFVAGLFDIDQPRTTDISSVGSAAHRALAREAVSKSAVLLKNNRVLPLNKKTKLLVAGSGANNIGRQSGAWTVEWQGIDGNGLPGATSLLEAIENEIGSEFVSYNRQAEFEDANTPVGLVVVSEPPYAEGFGDNPSPKISPEDIQAIENMKLRSDKVVIIIMSGRPIIVSSQIDEWDGLVAAWLPGSEASGLSDVLFGNRAFTAKLPLPWPRTVSQLPISNDGSTADGTSLLYNRGFGL